MPSQTVVVSAEEISQLEPLADFPTPTFQKLKSPVPRWARVCLSALAPLLPIVAIIAFVLRIAFRNQPSNVRYAWLSFMSTLLIVSALFSTVAAVVVVSFVPVPAIVNTGLPDLDERNQFVALPAKTVLASSDASEQLKPLVIVVSPTVRLWNHQDVPAPQFGAGALLFADKSGYLFATANHVVTLAADKSAPASGHAMVATASGVWSSAAVVATAPDLDLALLWVGRHSGSSEFVQPIATPQDGSAIFVIGHPEGLKFTLSTGIVSGLRDQTIQVSAAISPGNSGGPVYDDRGNLVGIVSSKFDHNIDPNAENIGFATKADALFDPSHWRFTADGKKLLERYTSTVKARRDAPSATDKPEK
ncbi:MAG TPA: trypsin-like peptidase domain-containing protein [Acidobacteriaceae bacterium]